jgi:hypothetical protein
MAIAADGLIKGSNCAIAPPLVLDYTNIRTYPNRYMNSVSRAQTRACLVVSVSWINAVPLHIRSLTG